MRHVDGDSDVVPPADSLGVGVGVGSSKEQWFLPAVLCGRKLSPAFALMSDNSVPPHMPLVSFKLLHQRWSSQGVNFS